MGYYFCEQGSTEWSELRRGRVTATGFCEFLTPSKFELKKGRSKYAIELALQRFRLEDAEPFQTEWMARGIELEPYAAEAWEGQTGERTGLVGFYTHPDFDFVGCSPDRHVGAEGLLEIKCPKNRTLLEYCQTDEIPGNYYLQIQAQLWVTGRKWCEFYAWSPDFNLGYRAKLEPDPKAFSAFEKNVPIFLDELKEASKMLEFLEPNGGV